MIVAQIHRRPLVVERVMAEHPRRGLIPVTRIRRKQGPVAVTIGADTLSIAAWGRRWGVTRTRARQRIHVAAGLCETCNAERVTARHCRRHADAWNARAA